MQEVDFEGPHASEMLAEIKATGMYHTGSAMVNDGNGAFASPAPGRRLFAGLCTLF